jgi:transposase
MKMHKEEERKKQDRMIELLEELVKWTKVKSIPHVKKLLLEILPSDEEKRAYHYSNGQDSRGVAKLAGVGHVAVTKWWKNWIRAGIAKPVSAKRGKRAKRVFSLEDFGIEVPLLKEVKPKVEKTRAPINLGKLVDEESVKEENSEEVKGI